ncbi:hypothetical protein PHMEG_00034657, partial [Phytophthora megakarya]
MMADPSSCFEHFQQALVFICSSSWPKIHIVEEQKAFQIQHGEKYIQLKNYADQLEAELRETKTKMQVLTTSNDELREAYKEKSRKCRNWEKMCKSLKSQPSIRGQGSPTRSTMGGMGMQQQDDNNITIPTTQFTRPSMRPMARSYGVDGSSSSMRNPMGNMGRAESPRTIQRPNEEFLVLLFNHWEVKERGLYDRKLRQRYNKLLNELGFFLRGRLLSL